MEDSGKFQNADIQYIIRDSRYIYFRVVSFPNKFFFMTATAQDAGRNYKVYPDSIRLMEDVRTVLCRHGVPISDEQDRNGKAYIQSEFGGSVFQVIVNDRQELGDLGSLIMEIVAGLPELEEADANYSDLRDLYRDLAIDDEGSDLYLSDGVFLTREGDLVER